MKGTLLGAEQLERLEALLREEAEASGGARAEAGPPALERVGRDDVLPLSFAQQRLWFLDQLEPGSAAYSIPLALRLIGPLEVSALGAGLDELVRRHESLRTTFPAAHDGQPAQLVSPPAPLPLPLTDLSALAPSERAQAERRLITDEARRPFDLSQGPLVRASLLRLSDTEHVLMLNLHHIVCDGWSMGILFRELAVLYESFARGEQSPLPEPSLQYADFAHWQRRWLSGEVLDGQLAYWRERLEGAPAVLELPADRPRPAAQSFRGAAYTSHISQDLTEALEGLSRREGVTLFMTLLAAFQALLMRYTSQEDIVVGTPNANRTRSELEGLVGFFINTLVLRTDTSGDPTFGELLRRVREVTLGAYAHQDVPFEKLVDALNSKRNLSHSPLYQVAFSLHSARMVKFELQNLNVTLLEDLGNESAKIDLNVVAIPRSGRQGVENNRAEGMNIIWEYSTDLFDAETVGRLARHFQTLLEGAAADPTLRLSELPLLSEDESHKLLVTWNQTERPYPPDATLHALFERQAALTPDAVAVVYAQHRLSYRELNERANRVAHYLRSLGVREESLVGVMMERSEELVVALLGVLKSGGAYVPLDPGYPEARLSFMAGDADLKVLLTQQRLVEELPEHRARVLCLDTEGEQIGRESSRNPDLHVLGENAAYVIYTSGSSGRPKGVVVSHRAVCNHMHWMQRVAPLDGSDCVLQKTPFSFDASASEFFWPLLAGARLLMARPGGHKDAQYLVGAVRAESVTVLQAVPSLLRLLVEEEQLEACTSLRHMFCGGEALPQELAERFEQIHGAQLFNLYGPTEAAIDVSAHRRERGERRGPTVPIGRPLDNTKLYVLDAAMRPVPVGVSGELYIGGDGLARGYLGRPELTAERFVPDPFSVDGARLYRTGDVVRHRADGELEFMGRADGQVKLRGFRIELGEIEAVLAGHARVRQAVVLLKGEGEAAQLVAYFVPDNANVDGGDDAGGVSRQTSAPAESELRQYARTLLPDHMVPQRVVMLEALPLTPNGKLDRARLPEPGRAEAGEMAGGFVAPRDAVEEVMAGIWKEVLGAGRVGVRDNFFDLGGHSLLATRVVSWVRKVFKVEAGLRGLFEEPTVEGFVGAVRREAGEDGWARMQRTAELLLALPAGGKFREIEGAEAAGV